SASFQPKVGIDFSILVDAATRVEEVFGTQVPELEQTAVARDIRKEVERVDGPIRDAHNLLVQQSLPGADALQAALDLSRLIRTASEEQTILAFNGAYRELKEAISRAADVTQALDPPHLHDLQRARHALTTVWPFLETEPDLDDALSEHATRLTDLMGRETFFRELAAIDQHTRALEQEYARRQSAAVQARASTYAEALERLRATPGWEKVTADQQSLVAGLLESCASTAVSDAVSIPQLRSDIDACSNRLNTAIAEVMRLVDGNRIAELHVSSFFSGGIETEEQLDAALQGLREQCMELLAAEKKILVR
ncbi:MAG: BREX system P-loop protein BrxC, partial [Chloroflexota bacterium]